MARQREDAVVTRRAHGEHVGAEYAPHIVDRGNCPGVGVLKRGEDDIAVEEQIGFRGREAALFRTGKRMAGNHSGPVACRQRRKRLGQMSLGAGHVGDHGFLSGAFFQFAQYSGRRQRRRGDDHQIRTGTDFAQSAGRIDRLLVERRSHRLFVEIHGADPQAGVSALESPGQGSPDQAQSDNGYSARFHASEFM